MFMLGFRCQSFDDVPKKNFDKYSLAVNSGNVVHTGYAGAVVLSETKDIVFSRENLKVSIRRH